MRALRRLQLAAALLLPLLSGPLGAQDVAEALPGTVGDRYLRALQVAGEAPLSPWSLRGLSPAGLQRTLPDSAHPWAARMRPFTRGVRLLRPRLEGTYNSAFPDGRNDGALWAGRGITLGGSAGAAARWGPLSVRLEPTAFWAQNASFALMEAEGPQPFADPDTPRRIDLPQRFGDGAYSRVDPGESTVRVDLAGIAVGVSTATQQWGPAIDQPLLLGPNAPGFLHAFAGTSTPWRVGIGRVHGRLVWGRLEQSPYSPVPADSARRYMAGITGVFQPRGLDGLEVGVSRFFHLPRPGGRFGARDLLRPIEEFFKAGLPSTGTGPDSVSDFENQLASVSARWVLPRGGLEFYAEYGREDHGWDLQDLLLEPDHSAFWVAGASRAWRRGASLLSLRGEVASSQASHVATVRRQARTYTHTRTRQGHTHAGQLLGSPALAGGGGHVLALEAFTPRGGWGVDWTRTRVRDNWGDGPATGAVPDPMTDVVHSLGAQALVFGDAVDLVLRMRGSWELNRHFRGDAFNLNAAAGIRLNF